MLKLEMETGGGWGGSLVVAWVPHLHAACGHIGLGLLGDLDGGGHRGETSHSLGGLGSHRAGNLGQVEGSHCDK